MLWGRKWVVGEKMSGAVGGEGAWMGVDERMGRLRMVGEPLVSAA